MYWLHRTPKERMYVVSNPQIGKYKHWLSIQKVRYSTQNNTLATLIRIGFDFLVYVKFDCNHSSHHNRFGNN